MSQKKVKVENKRKTVGLALGGGSAKGLAHIGVIKALTEIGVPIDYIAGTSIGALVGGWFALSGNISSMEDFVSSLKIKERKILSKVSFRGGHPHLGNESITSVIDDHFGAHRLEECKIPFRAVATDVKKGDEVILSEGSMAEAIKASAALPIIFDPVEIGGRTLIDGGIANPVPADVVRDMGADIVIAVDVITKWVDISSLTGESLSIRNIQPVFSGVISILGYQVAREKLKNADIVIKPPVSGYKMLDFRQAEDIIAAGYKTTRSQYGEICRLIGRENPKKNALDEFWEFVFGLE